VAGACPGWSGRVITALGVGAHLERLGVTPAQITELDWFEGTFVQTAGDRVEVIATPAQHFSGRGALDRNRTLWASLSIVGPQHRVFFSGDTGATDEHTAVGQQLGPFDVALFEIGAWHPAWGVIHLGPQAAFEAFAAMGARSLLPVHWSTFDLGLHHWAEPAETLFRRAEDERAAVWFPQVGGSIEPDRAGAGVAGRTVARPWWRDVL
jgi:L-ascorbate metabolism protein UlaG (beta-lactamase superfamily)